MNKKGSSMQAPALGQRKKLHVLISRDRYLLAMVAIPLIYFILFHYVPMYGVQIAFKRYSPGRGIWGSAWVGLKWFEEFFSSIYAGRLIRNILILNILRLVIAFPLPILFALLLNELRNVRYKKLVQTVSYMPHFISTVVVVGMIFTFLSPNDGIVNAVIKRLGGNPINFMGESQYYRGTYLISGIWQNLGWDSIIYLAALSNIDMEQYEAARIDGANTRQQMWHITLPGIAPTIIILLILDIGNMMSIGYEKTILMYSPATYDVADVISSYVYRVGIVNNEFSFAAAVDLFNSVVNCILLVGVNTLSKKVTDVALW